MFKKGYKQTEEHKRKIGLANSLSRRGLKLSDEQKKKMSDSHKKIGSRPPIMYGNNNPKWRGGKIRIRALIKDNYTCRNCGNNDRDVLMVDHIVPTKIRPDLIAELENLQVLCANCHIKKTKQDNRAIILLKLSRGEKIPN